MTQTSVHSTAHDWLFLVRSICHWDWTHSSLASGSWQTSSPIPCQIKILNPSSLMTCGKNNFSTSQNVVKRRLFLCLQNFTFWVSPIGDVFRLRFRDNFKHFQKTTWLPRDFVNVDCELWPVKAFCWILPAFGFGHLVGKAGYRFRLMLSVAICAISSK